MCESLEEFNERLCGLRERNQLDIILCVSLIEHNNSRIKLGVKTLTSGGYRFYELIFLNANSNYDIINDKW